MFKAIREIVGFLAKVAALFLGICVVFAFLAWEAMGPSPAKMKADAARTQISLLKMGVSNYHDTVGSYPPSLQSLRVAPSDLPAEKWKGPYLDREISLDPWGHPYQYSRPGNHNPDGFDLWTVSPDGREIGNWESTEGLDRARTEVGILAEAVKKYHDTAGSYPPNLNALLVAPEVLPPVKWAGPYLDREPPAPWGGRYRYASPGRHNPDSFDVWTVSPDGQEIGNWTSDERPAGSGRMPATHN